MGRAAWGSGLWFLRTCCTCSATSRAPTLCDPLDRSPPGSSVHGTLPGRNLEQDPTLRRLSMG